MNYPEHMGTYKALVLSHTVEPSSKAKIPTFKMRVALTEYFDEAEKEWFDCSDEKYALSAFLCLYKADDKSETLNHNQVCSVFGWDGCGFGHLLNDVHEGLEIQVRVKESDNEKYPVEINWIDTVDADPSGGYKKLSDKETADLNAQFADFLGGRSKAGKKVKTTTARKPNKSKLDKAKAATKKATTPGEDTQSSDPPEEISVEDKKAALRKKSERLRKQQENERAKTAGAVPPKSTKANKNVKPRILDEGDELPVDFGKKDAWANIVAGKHEACDDATLTAEWHAAIGDISDDGDEDNLDAEGWWNVVLAVLANVGKDA
jgi:hypothetical protein